MVAGGFGCGLFLNLFLGARGVERGGRRQRKPLEGKGKERHTSGSRLPLSELPKIVPASYFRKAKRWWKEIGDVAKSFHRKYEKRDQSMGGCGIFGS